MRCSAGTSVLVRAKVLADGKVLVAPGACVSAECLDIVARDVSDGKLHVMVGYFRNADDLRSFAEAVPTAGRA